MIADEPRVLVLLRVHSPLALGYQVELPVRVQRTRRVGGREPVDRSQPLLGLGLCRTRPTQAYPIAVHDDNLTVGVRKLHAPDIRPPSAAMVGPYQEGVPEVPSRLEIDTLGGDAEHTLEQRLMHVVGR